MSQPPVAGKERLLDRVRGALRVRHMSPRTERTYVHWIRRYILFHKKRHPLEMAEPEINSFLTHLATARRISPATQTQALCALLFLYRHVLSREIGDLDVVRARRRPKIPVVLTRDEVRSVLDRLEGADKLFCTLLYGTGLRLMEGLRLRVKDLDFSLGEVVVHDGKGAKDRRTMLPQAIRPALEAHLRQVAALHRSDLAAGHGRVYMPYALERKYPRAASEWAWQYVFPAAGQYRDPRTGALMRHHLHERTVQKAFHAAVRAAGLAKPASCHCLRHYPDCRIIPIRGVADTSKVVGI
jgi:integron integrase